MVTVIFSSCIDDHSRVRLQVISSEAGSDYINANYIDVSTLCVCVCVCMYIHTYVHTYIRTSSLGIV